MTIKPSEAATGLTAWMAEGPTETDVQNGLASGFIEWEGVRMKINNIQDWPLGNGIITKMVMVEMTPEVQERLNRIMVQKAKAGVRW